MLTLLPAHVVPSFFATHAGAEIDLVLDAPSAPPVAVEVKLSSAPTVTRGMHVAMTDLGCERGFVVTPGTDRYPLGGRIEAIGLHAFLRDVIAPLAA